MNTVKRLATAGSTLAIALATLATPASAAGTTTRWVDHDGHAGPHGCGGSRHAATSIQSAVDASNADDVVIVCPGTYVGQVRIRGSRDGLTLRSSKPFGATIKGPAHIARPLGFGYLMLVDHVDDVTIRGFKVLTRTAAPCDDTDVTIGVLGSLRTAIRGNRVLANGSNGHEACSQAIGIAVVNGIEDGQPGGASSTMGTATIAYNEVRDARFGAIMAFAVGGRVDVDVAHNSVRAYFGQPPGGSSAIMDVAGAQLGVGFLGSARGSVTDNVIQGSSAAPTNGPTFYVGVAIMADFDGPGTQRNGPIAISDNLIRRVGVGVSGQAARKLTLRTNRISNAYTGIDLEQTISSTVKANSIRSKQVGIHLDGGSTGNTLTGNSARSTGGVCVDQSSGSGTSGTANVWMGNVSDHGSSPDGLCDQEQ